LPGFVVGVVATAVTSWAMWPEPASPPAAAPPRPPAEAPSTPAPPRSSISFDGKAGPWGRLEYTPIVIAPPRELLKVDGEITPTRWAFPGYSRAKVEQLLRAVGLDASELATLAASPWKVNDTMTSVTPPPSLILELKPEVRSDLYAVLARFPENLHNAALAFTPETLERRLAGSGLSPRSVGLFRRLVYRQGDVLFFADDRALLPLLDSPEQRARLALFLARKETLAVRLKIDAKTDIDQLLRYWGFNGRSKDIEPILASLLEVPGGYELDMAHLLPAIPRRRIFTYPRPGPSGDEAKNCHWTSLNFHRETADDRLTNMAAAKAELAAHYRRVTEPTFGDLVMLLDADTSSVVHTATYLADDLVFTKNGIGLAQPWLYMPLRSLADLYGLQLGKPGGIKILLYRRKHARA
jgi:hypothetical protein